MNGYLAFDATREGKRPGILVVHEWWGHNEYARRRADMLAELGYTALAVDMFGNGRTADHPDDAMAFVQETMSSIESARGRFEAALEVLSNHETVEREKMGAIGYCFGGGVVLEMARRSVDLDGVASFHGGLSTPAPAAEGAVKARIAVFHGGSDPMITAEQVQSFRQEMDAAGAEYEVVVYDDATHSFTNPDADSIAAKFGLPVGYNVEADNDSWQKMTEFFSDAFGR
jgi:dienelactone hydrolase